MIEMADVGRRTNGQKGTAFQQGGIGVGNSCVWVLTSLWGEGPDCGVTGAAPRTGDTLTRGHERAKLSSPLSCLFPRSWRLSLSVSCTFFSLKGYTSVCETLLEQTGEMLSSALSRRC